MPAGRSTTPPASNVFFSKQCLIIKYCERSLDATELNAWDLVILITNKDGLMTHEEGVMPDVEFVTKVKNNICLKSLLAGVKFSGINA